jgi:hypothetical protein
MEFRWVAGITLWTILSGPVFVGVQQYAPQVSATKAQTGATNWTKVVRVPSEHAARR